MHAPQRKRVVARLHFDLQLSQSCLCLSWSLFPCRTATGSRAGTAHAGLDFDVGSHLGVCAQVCGVYGSWHLGKLQVGLSRAIRLAQCRSCRIVLREALPVQVIKK